MTVTRPACRVPQLGVTGTIDLPFTASQEMKERHPRASDPCWMKYSRDPTHKNCLCGTASPVLVCPWKICGHWPTPELEIRTVHLTCNFAVCKSCLARTGPAPHPEVCGGINNHSLSRPPRIYGQQFLQPALMLCVLQTQMTFAAISSQRASV